VPAGQNWLEAVVNDVAMAVGVTHLPDGSTNCPAEHWVVPVVATFLPLASAHLPSGVIIFGGAQDTAAVFAFVVGL
jgi:hypothetical protein